MNPLSYWVSAVDIVSEGERFEGPSSTDRHPTKDAKHDARTAMSQYLGEAMELACIDSGFGNWRNFIAVSKLCRGEESCALVHYGTAITFGHVFLFPVAN